MAFLCKHELDFSFPDHWIRKSSASSEGPANRAKREASEKERESVEDFIFRVLHLARITLSQFSGQCSPEFALFFSLSAST